MRGFLEWVDVCELTPVIRRSTVSLRRNNRLKLPDAIICATALEYGVELWTNDAALEGVPGLIIRNVIVHP